MVEGDKATRSKEGVGVAEKAKMPKGGRKGGTMFPRLALQQALEYSKKLVSKTAVAAQPEATILAGVFNNAGPDGKVRLSALKQFGLLEGSAAAYKATQLAREIEQAADEPEKTPLWRRAMLVPKVYRELFNTYQGDQTSKAKIRGRVQQLGVHPDLSETCADLFVTSALTSALATVDGDGIRLTSAADVVQPVQAETPEAEGSDTGERVDAGPLVSDVTAGMKRQEEQTGAGVPQIGLADASKLAAPRPRTAADVKLNLTIDSSLDGDKLEKQLELLRRYGLI